MASGVGLLHSIGISTPVHMYPTHIHRERQRQRETQRERDRERETERETEDRRQWGQDNLETELAIWRCGIWCFPTQMSLIQDK